MDAVLFKAAARGREVQEKREAERRRALLVLILRHLTDHGYIEAAERVSTESNVTLAKYDAADNISLLQILQDFEEAQEQRYGKRPKLVKQLTCEVPSGGGGSRQVSRQSSQHQNTLGLVSNVLCPAPPISGQLAAQQRREKVATAAASCPAAAPRQQSVAGAAGKLPALSRSVSQTDRGGQHSSNANQEQQGQGSRQQSADGSVRPALEISGHGCEVGPSAGRGPKQRNSNIPDLSGDEEDTWAARLLKPLPTTLLGELRQLGAAISQDIYQESPNVRWSDIAGLTDAKWLLQESVGLPMRYPELFTGLLAPWRGVLLYGPPGTGKTLLAKAVATSCKTTFFNISASSIVSKWRGDSEKLVRVLFDLARHHAPATIFLDEVDALMGARGVEGEHEASRRMKTELLIQMDGLTRSSSSSAEQQAEPQVFVLAASNLPWDLDQALLRRLQKRILVPLPDIEARRSMLEGLLAGRLDAGEGLLAGQIDGLVQATEGYSGSDITLLAKEAAMRPLRRLLAVLEPNVYAGSTAAVGTAATAAAQTQSAAGSLQTAGVKTLTAAGASAGSTCTQATSAGVAAAGGSAGGAGGVAGGTGGSQAPSLELGPVTADDLSAALSVTKPSAQGYDKQYAEFSSKFGQAG